MKIIFKNKAGNILYDYNIRFPNKHIQQLKHIHQNNSYKIK